MSGDTNAAKIAARAAYEKEQSREAKRQARAESLVNPKRK